LKLAVSNIAWTPAERDSAYAILRNAGIRGLEIAPGIFFAGATDPFEPTAQEAAAATKALDCAGLHLVSMQSLLFGIRGAALFEGPEPRERLEIALLKAINFAQRFAIPNLVFGSPLQRVIPYGLDHSDAEASAIELFRSLGDVAVAAGSKIAIEPNPAIYGTNFLNRVEEADDFVRKVAHPGIVLNFDVGALHLEGEFKRLKEIASETLPRIGHVHISEPMLAPAPAETGEASRVLAALDGGGYTGWYSLEMKATGKENLRALEASINRLIDAARAVKKGAV
jgi:sugar phosphate isomerase/epimerase